MTQQADKFIQALLENHKEQTLSKDSFLNTIFELDTVENKNLIEIFPHVFTKTDEFIDKSTILFHQDKNFVLGSLKDYFWLINNKGGIGEIDCIGFSPLDILSHSNPQISLGEDNFINFLNEQHPYIDNPRRHMRDFKDFCASYGYDFQYEMPQPNPLIRKAFLAELLSFINKM